MKIKECVDCNSVFEAKSDAAKYCSSCKTRRVSEYNKAAYLKNKEKILAGKKEYYQTNRESIIEKKKEYNKGYWERPEIKAHIKEYRKEYYKDNKESIVEKKREYNQRPEVKARRNHNNKLREVRKMQAVPAWFDKEEVKYIYQLAKERGLEVDHMVPLKSDLVCGLHVQDNLRCISTELNRRKSNLYWPDMPEEVAA